MCNLFGLRYACVATYIHTNAYIRIHINAQLITDNHLATCLPHGANFFLRALHVHGFLVKFLIELLSFVDADIAFYKHLIHITNLSFQVHVFTFLINRPARQKVRIHQQMTISAVTKYW